MFELDHLPFGVANAEAIRAALESLGFTPTAASVCRWTLRDGAHAARALSVVFERGYLDLVEMEDRGRAGDLRTSPVYAQGVAPSGIVLACASVDQSRAALAAKGIAVGRPYQIVRVLPGADPPEIRYEIFALREPSLPFALMTDSAPSAMRTRQWLAHPNSATGIGCLHLRVPSLETWRRQAAALFGGLISATAVELDLGAASLVVHEQPRDAYLAVLSRLLPAQRATLLAVEFSVTDLDATRALLRRGRVPSFELAGGIAVEPSAGYGCGIVFSDAGRGTRCCG